jgi:3'(2'), 5'-bisphosphate nucleotidase
MKEQNRRSLLDVARHAARGAGDRIMAIYGGDVPAEIKSDGSPLTLADKAAHEVICAALADTGIVVVSEEGDDLQLDATVYWLVDPLDGTKDFLARTDDFTVNIALVEDGRPVLGVVYAPARDLLFSATRGGGGFREHAGASLELSPRPRSTSCRLAASRFHDSPEVEVFAALNGIGDREAIGSALKYGALAAGEADVFPRITGSCEWDTAAGQAVLEAVGGQVLDWHDGTPLRYGKARRRNPRLLTLRAPYTFEEFIRQPLARGIP